ncbi:ABC transporter substrate-binding protein [Aestuariimicrobium soli]|uniref:ABC transporter substrate-binding protein n=1 Tax=Aestuariimicrobium soli TaxID=2035834 RepID=UPI003EBF097A
MASKRILGAVTAAMALGMTLTACSGSADAPVTTDSTTPVTMQFWHNSTTGDGAAYWQQTVKEFQTAHPNVTIKITAIQNEDMDGKLQTAFNSGTAPDIFMARGGGKLADVVHADMVMDLTDKISADTKSAYGDAIFSTFTVDGKVYGMPTSVLPDGIYYSKELFKKAGIDTPPTTMAELSDAVTKLKAAGITPIALGGKDAWPAAHWYYLLALRACSQDVLTSKAMGGDFSDPCWTKAGEDLKAFADTKPFNEGFLTTSAQQGAGSSAGLLANHKAAMELMGAWEPGVVGSLTPDEKPLPDLGWFPFPSVEGGQGDAKAMIGGADGYSCSKKAPAVCADFLNFAAQKSQQEGYAKAFNTLPANQQAQSVVTDPALKDNLTAYNDASYVVLFLDTLYGQNVGNALNGGVVDLLAGKGQPADIVKAAQAAASKG